MKRAATILLLIAALAACTSEPDDTLRFDSTTTTSTDASTTAAPEITSALTTTVTTEVVADTTTTAVPESTSSEAPTTAPAIDTEAQVRADFDLAINARLACGQDPTSCDFATFSISGSPIDVFLRDLMAQRIVGNQRTVLGNGNYRWRIDHVEVQGSTALVTTCIFDSLIVFDVGDLDDPSDDVVANGNVSSRIDTFEVRFDGSTWRIFDNVTLEQSQGVDLCGFS